jgi:hypothetical protein
MFSTISALAIQVGSAIKKELWDKVKNNFDDHETRLNLIETVAKKIKVMKFDFRNGSSFSTATGVYYWESDDDLTITDAFLRIYEKGALAGSIQIDLKKSTTDLNGTSFFTIFTTRPSINFATAADYDSSINQVFDPGQISVAKGDFIRLDITQFPSGGILGKFLLTVYGE